MRRQNERGQVAAGLAWIGGGIVVVALFVGILIGGQRLGWWMRAYDVNQENHVYQQSYGSQSAYAEQLSNDEDQVARIDVQIADKATPADEIPPLQSQRAAVVTEACDLFSKITEPTATARSWAAANCN